MCMSLTYKFVLDKRRIKPNNVYPVKLRVYYTGGFKEKSLDIDLNEKDWDNEAQSILKSDPNYKANSYKLSSVKSKLDRRLLLATDEEIVLSAEELLAVLEKKVVKTSNISFNEFANSLINDMIKAGKAGNALAYTDAVNSLVSFTGNKQMRFENINYTLLEKYNTAKLAQGLKVNSIAAYLRSIRAIYNKAIKAEIVTADKYPFSKFSIEKEDTPSRKLTIEELKRIMHAQLREESSAWHYRNYFLLSFTLIGMNFADLFTLTKANIVDGNISYQRHKTGRLYNFSIHPYAKELMEYYSTRHSKNKHNFLLPELQLGLDALAERKRIKQICKNCSKHMKNIAKSLGITKPISTYYARYSWANIAKELGYSNDLIAEALGHEYGNNVTNIYLDNYDNKTISEANSKVVATVLNKTEGL